MGEHVKIEDATREQLQRHAELVMGLEGLGDRPQRATLLAKIEEAGWPLDSIPTLFAPTAAPPPAAGHISAGTPFMAEFNGSERECLRIRIHEGGPGELKAVPLSHNGKAIYVERGKDSTIPVEYVFGPLVDAVEDVFDPPSSEEDLTRGLKAPRHVPSYPFSYV